MTGSLAQFIVSPNRLHASLKPSKTAKWGCGMSLKECLQTPTQGSIRTASCPCRLQRVVPYRDSTLTKLLYDGLKGDGRVLMLACAAPTKVSKFDTGAGSVHMYSKTVAENETNSPSQRLSSKLPMMTSDELDLSSCWPVQPPSVWPECTCSLTCRGCHQIWHLASQPATVCSPLS